jgi:hypothetical protein
MKKRSLFAAIRPNGILHWSTACILFGSAAGLTSCNREDRYVATEKDIEMARTQSTIEVLDAQQELLKKGEVANNFSIPGVGYYHAANHDFYEHPYNFERDGKWFVNGVWQDQSGDETIDPSRPSPAALKKVDDALAREQQLAKGSSNSQASHGGGMGMGNMLMMYWLLSGNRGMFSPGNGFRQASQNAGNWQNNVEQQRRDVRSHASGNPGYSRMVESNRTSGSSVKSGSSVRGGFGSSGSSHSSSSFGG